MKEWKTELVDEETYLKEQLTKSLHGIPRHFCDHAGPFHATGTLPDQLDLAAATGTGR